MSIVMNLRYTGKGGNARAFAEEMEKSGIAARIRKEEGNEGYEYFYPAADSETVLLIDRWRNKEALDAHHASPEMKEIANMIYRIVTEKESAVPSVKKEAIALMKRFIK